MSGVRQSAISSSRTVYHLTRYWSMTNRNPKTRQGKKQIVALGVVVAALVEEVVGVGDEVVGVDSKMAFWGKEMFPRCVRRIYLFVGCFDIEKSDSFQAEILYLLCNGNHGNFRCWGSVEVLTYPPKSGSQRNGKAHFVSLKCVSSRGLWRLVSYRMLSHLHMRIFTLYELICGTLRCFDSVLYQSTFREITSVLFVNWNACLRLVWTRRLQFT